MIRHILIAVIPLTFATRIVQAAEDAPGTAPAKSADQAPKPRADPRLDRNTPEGTLRVFTLGAMISNKDLLKATMVPVSDEDMQYLLKEQAVSKEDFKKIKEQIAGMEVRHLKPGDRVKLPKGTELVVKDDEVTDDRLVLVLGDSPIPTRLYKAKGFWWIDASPVIAGRKAAEKKRLEIEKREQSQDPKG
jgi:hypothetical protein